jgi:hypothetical protein
MSVVFTVKEVSTEAEEAGGKLIACGVGLVSREVGAFWLKNIEPRPL